MATPGNSATRSLRSRQKRNFILASGQLDRDVTNEIVSSASCGIDVYGRPAFARRPIARNGFFLVSIPSRRMLIVTGLRRHGYTDQVLTELQPSVVDSVAEQPNLTIVDR